MPGKFPERIDLHLHTVSSDGTDSPSELLEKVRLAGVEFFSVTDHDTYLSCEDLLQMLSSPQADERADRNEPAFITGIEFSCRDDGGKYHILGYGFDVDSDSMRGMVRKMHDFRMRKTLARMDFLEQEMHLEFSMEDKEALLGRPNPGKPHFANLLIKYGYASDKEEAFRNILNRKSFPEQYITPEEAIAVILESGGIPVLAHPSFGSGSERIVGEEMEKRLQTLIDYGLEGVEAYYSGFSKELEAEMLHFARQYNLYVTAGSDYHGDNKSVYIGQTNLEHVSSGAPGLHRFLERVLA